MDNTNNKVNPVRHATAFAIDGVGYLAGGSSGPPTATTANPFFYEYNPATNVWTLLFRGGYLTKFQHNSFIVNNTPYVFDEYYLMPYDVNKKQFLYRENILPLGTSGASFFVLHNVPYKVHGYSNGTYDKRLWYDPAATSSIYVANEDDFSLPSKVNNTLDFTWKKNPATLTIITTSGKVIMQKDIQTGENTMDLSYLPQELYLVSLQSGSESFTYKIIKE
ncbi:MAG: T9SS type A sorting domain-containing protein [Candidatus Azobacteroides sp.]|nr:T9SS type A sorting domain-containing protein [Candidatus Azobacteroides sp.]